MGQHERVRFGESGAETQGTCRVSVSTIEAHVLRVRFMIMCLLASPSECGLCASVSVSERDTTQGTVLFICRSAQRAAGPRRLVYNIPVSVLDTLYGAYCACTVKERYEKNVMCSSELSKTVFPIPCLNRRVHTTQEFSCVALRLL